MKKQFLINQLARCDTFHDFCQGDRAKQSKKDNMATACRNFKKLNARVENALDLTDLSYLNLSTEFEKLNVVPTNLFNKINKQACVEDQLENPCAVSLQVGEKIRYMTYKCELIVFEICSFRYDKLYTQVTYKQGTCDARGISVQIDLFHDKYNKKQVFGWFKVPRLAEIDEWTKLLNYMTCLPVTEEEQVWEALEEPDIITGFDVVLQAKQSKTIYIELFGEQNAKPFQIVDYNQDVIELSNSDQPNLLLRFDLYDVPVIGGWTSTIEKYKEHKFRKNNVLYKCMHVALLYNCDVWLNEEIIKNLKDKKQIEGKLYNSAFKNSWFIKNFNIEKTHFQHRNFENIQLYDVIIVWFIDEKETGDGTLMPFFKPSVGCIIQVNSTNNFDIFDNTAYHDVHIIFDDGQVKESHKTFKLYSDNYGEICESGWTYFSEKHVKETKQTKLQKCNTILKTLAETHKTHKTLKFNEHFKMWWKTPPTEEEKQKYLNKHTKKTDKDFFKEYEKKNKSELYNLCKFIEPKTQLKNESMEIAFNDVKVTVTYEIVKIIAKVHYIDDPELKNKNTQQMRAYFNKRGPQHTYREDSTIYFFYSTAYLFKHIQSGWARQYEGFYTDAVPRYYSKYNKDVFDFAHLVMPSLNDSQKVLKISYNGDMKSIVGKDETEITKNTKIIVPKPDEGSDTFSTEVEKSLKDVILKHFFQERLQLNFIVDTGSKPITNIFPNTCTVLKDWDSALVTCTQTDDEDVFPQEGESWDNIFYQYDKKQFVKYVEKNCCLQTMEKTFYPILHIRDPNIKTPIGEKEFIYRTVSLLQQCILGDFHTLRHFPRINESYDKSIPLDCCNYAFDIKRSGDNCMIARTKHLNKNKVHVFVTEDELAFLSACVKDVPCLLISKKGVNYQIWLFNPKVPTPSELPGIKQATGAKRKIETPIPQGVPKKTKTIATPLIEKSILNKRSRGGQSGGQSGGSSEEDKDKMLHLDINSAIEDITDYNIQILVAVQYIIQYDYDYYMDIQDNEKPGMFTDFQHKVATLIVDSYIPQKQGITKEEEDVSLGHILMKLDVYDIEYFMKEGVDEKEKSEKSEKLKFIIATSLLTKPYTALKYYKIAFEEFEDFKKYISPAQWATRVRDTREEKSEHPAILQRSRSSSALPDLASNYNLGHLSTRPLSASRGGSSNKLKRKLFIRMLKRKLSRKMARSQV